MKISKIRMFRIEGYPERSAFEPEECHALPLDVYGLEAKAAVSADKPIDAHYVEVVAEEGARGVFGPVNPMIEPVVRTTLSPLIRGKNPLASELLSDQMIRAERHRYGLVSMAVSALDCALWDLRGKVWEEPVYRLLGGPTRNEVPAYASMLGFSVEPERAAEAASERKQEGYQAQKWFFRYGPGHGLSGKEKNLALVKALRDAVGPLYPLMFDAVTGWDVPYAVEVARAMEPYAPFWLEDPVSPDMVGGLHRIRSSCRVPIATGDLLYGRWQAKEMLQSDCADFLQTDPVWTGGISEQVKIAGMASAFGVPLYQHGHALLPALHVAAAQPPSTVPMVEYLVLAQRERQHFHRPFYEPEGGHLPLPDLPGLGLTFAEEKVSTKEMLR